MVASLEPNLSRVGEWVIETIDFCSTLPLSCSPTAFKTFFLPRSMKNLGGGFFFFRSAECRKRPGWGSAPPWHRWTTAAGSMVFRETEHTARGATDLCPVILVQQDWTWSAPRLNFSSKNCFFPVKSLGRSFSLGIKDLLMNWLIGSLIKILF